MTDRSEIAATMKRQARISRTAVNFLGVLFRILAAHAFFDVGGKEGFFMAISAIQNSRRDGRLTLPPGKFEASFGSARKFFSTCS